MQGWNPRGSTRRSWSARLRLLGWMALTVAIPALSAAATDRPAAALTVDDAVRVALARDRSLARLTAEADALAEQAVADGQLPDPELMVGYQNLPLDGFPTTDDMMTMLMVGVRQQFPAGRTRHLRRDLGELTSAARRTEGDARRLEIVLEVRRAWLDWRYAHRAAALVREVQGHFAELSALTERRIAAGTALQRDLSRARLEHLAILERIIELEAEREAAAAELGRWMDQPVTQSRPPDDDAGWPAPDAGAIRAALHEHPTLQQLDRLVDAGRTGTDIARQAYRPSWMVELGYGYRRGADMATGSDRSDMLTAMVSVSLPLFPGGRQDRAVAAARRDEDAARYAHADRLRHLASDLARESALWARYDELVRILEDDLLPEAGQTASTTESAYRSGRATFEELIRARVDELDYRLRALALTRQRDQARVALLYLSGD
jgi:outer membrane protein TolC